MDIQYTDIIKNTIRDLKIRRDVLNNEIIKIDLAINKFDLITIDDSVNFPLDSKNFDNKPITVIRNKPAKKVTEQQVRDAIIYMYKNKNFPIDQEYFSNRTITKHLGISSYNKTIKNILDKFVEKGMLESKPYKKGVQYKYLSPESEKINNKKSDNVINYKNPVPGINNNKFNSRNKDIEYIVRETEKRGFKNERTGSDHVRIYNNTGQFVTLSTTGNKSHEVLRLRRQLSKIGIIV